MFGLKGKKGSNRGKESKATQEAKASEETRAGGHGIQTFHFLILVRTKETHSSAKGLASTALLSIQTKAGRLRYVTRKPLVTAQSPEQKHGERTLSLQAVICKGALILT